MDVARQIKQLLSTEAYGTYHCTAQGSCTWYELALEIFKCAGYEEEVNPNGLVHLIPNPESLVPSTQDLKPIIVKPVTSKEFPQPARRPKNSALENYMLQLQNLDIMPPWQKSLEKFMTAIDSQRSAVNRQQPKG
jgi:dTDP-4-dehydrorhamnose reductase